MQDDTQGAHPIRIEGVEQPVEFGCRSGYCDLTCSTDLDRAGVMRFLMQWKTDNPINVPNYKKDAFARFSQSATPGLGGLPRAKGP